jgi:hypothetical protein
VILQSICADHCAPAAELGKDGVFAFEAEALQFDESIRAGVAGVLQVITISA